MDWNFSWGIPSEATNIIAIAAGDNHSLALRADGRIIGWGAGGPGAGGTDAKGQTIIPDNATNLVAIGAGYRHSLALRADGAVIVWGDSNTGYGVTNVPAGLTSLDLIGVGCEATHIEVVDKRTP